MVSIIVPSYNHVKFLPRRVESIFEQSYKDYELIIFDDGSTDESQKFLKTLNGHPKVKHLHFSNSNSGSPFGLWKKAITVASGDLIWIAESDDFCHSEFLNELVDFFSNPSVCLAYCSSQYYIDNRNEFWDVSWLSDFPNYIWDKEFVMSGKFFLKEYSLFKCPIINVSSVVFRKKDLNEIIFPDSFKYSGDWYFWNQLFLKGDVAYKPKVLNYMRRHEGATTFGKVNFSIERILENTFIIKESFKLLNLKIYYSSKFEWLLLMWKKYIYKNPLRGVYYAFFYLPNSFLLSLFKKLS